MNEGKNIHRIRAAIDETDDGILKLIERRLELACEMAAAKPSGQGHSPLRPARESSILERLNQKAAGASAQLIEVVWRELIGQGRQAQGPMRLVLFAGEEHRLFEECARRHFSSAIAVEWAESRETALKAAREHPVIAVLDVRAEDLDLTPLGEIKTSAGETIGFAFARIAAEGKLEGQASSYSDARPAREGDPV